MPSEARVALITGCGKPVGIGNSTARALATAGMTVVVSDVSPAGVANEHVFLPATAPSGVGLNEYYKSDEDYFHALAAEMSKEYRAIVDAGILVQIDDPFLPDIFYEVGLDDAQKKRRAQIYVEAINTALKGIPVEYVRFHTCYGINEGPRVHDGLFNRSLICAAPGQDKGNHHYPPDGTLLMLTDGARHFDKAERGRQHALRRIQRRRTASVVTWNVMPWFAVASATLAALWLWHN